MNPFAASYSSVSRRSRLDPDSKISVEFRRVFAILARNAVWATGESEALAGPPGRPLSRSKPLEMNFLIGARLGSGFALYTVCDPR